MIQLKDLSMASDLELPGEAPAPAQASMNSWTCLGRLPACGPFGLKANHSRPRPSAGPGVVRRTLLEAQQSSASWSGCCYREGRRVRA